ncbi:MAG TPA: EamA family transporter, partial [candidate division Zixibacteria bacterium]|nr:EamA family transporter [candidate division Zixibacteria bacterium]
MEFIGEAAALTTALCWAFTSLFFSEAGKLIGSFKVNNIRLLMAVSIYTVVLLLYKGSLIPETLTINHVIWLGLSGIAGLVIGDGAGFKAMVMIGPRLTSLLYSLAPVMASIIAWLFLGEALGLFDMLGISLTMGGIGWVVSERQYNKNNLSDSHPDKGSLRLGI